MGFSHVFKIVQMVPNCTKHNICTLKLFKIVQSTRATISVQKLSSLKLKTIKLTSKRYVRGFMGEYLRYYRLCNYSLVYFVFAK